VGYTEKIVIIGAGITGLACAHRLKQLGVRALVLEATDRPGGLISTIRRDGYLFETGPQCPRFPASVWGLVRELGLEKEFVPGDPKAKRYIYRNGRLHLAPFSPVGLLSTQLLKWRSKVRILTEVFGYSRPPEQEESLAAFVERKFGAEVHDNLVDPIIATIFFGDSQKMGMESAFPVLVDWERNYGSLVRGALRTRRSKRSETFDAGPNRKKSGKALRVTDQLPCLGTFRSGMATLPETLAKSLQTQIRYRAEATLVSPVCLSTAGAIWQIDLQNGERIETANVVLAIPAHAAAKQLQKTEPQLASLLAGIEYAPACVVSLVYAGEQLTRPLDGSSVMVPRLEGLHTVCMFWNSAQFSGRAPASEVILTSFAMSREGSDLFRIADSECAEIIHQEASQIIGIRGNPTEWSVWRDSRGLPQYNLKHKRRVGQIYSSLRDLPGLYLTGNYLKGRSLGECVESAFQQAEELCSRTLG
jgi:protoporphyrinogen/coproporphyrinogen III oxidase